MMAIIFVSVSFIAVLLGGYIYVNPERVIDLQKRFYTLINWRMEPISMSKEIRNTRLMGLFLIIFTLMSGVYYWLQ